MKTKMQYALESKTIKGVYMTDSGKGLGVLGDQSAFLPGDRMKVFFKYPDKYKRSKEWTVVQVVKTGDSVDRAGDVC